MKSNGVWSNHSELSTKEEFLPINEIGTYVTDNGPTSRYTTFSIDMSDNAERIIVGAGSVLESSIYRRNPLLGTYQLEHKFGAYSEQTDSLMASMNNAGDLVAHVSWPQKKIYVNQYDGASWNLIQQISFNTPQQGAPYLITISMDATGDRIVASQHDSGYAHVYKRNSNTWSLETTLTTTPVNGIYSVFVAPISRDGSRVAIGHCAGAAVYVYVRNGTTWTLVQTLTTPGSGNYFGVAVDISDNGEVIAIGAHLSNNTYIYRKVNGTWTLKSTLSGNPSITRYGFPVRLNSDGSTLAVGALDGNRFTVYKT